MRTCRFECIFPDYPDTVVNGYGARGIGGIGLTGCASAWPRPYITLRTGSQKQKSAPAHRHFRNCFHTWTRVCIWRGLGSLL